jgi:WD40 repeat protein
LEGKSLRELGVLAGHSRPVRRVAFSADGTILASADDTMVRLWNLPTGEGFTVLRGVGADVALSPDGRTLASASGVRGGTARLWDMDVLKVLFEYEDSASAFSRMAQASWELLPYRLDGFTLEFTSRRTYLSPRNGYTFIEHSSYRSLRLPRPPERDPIEWLLENVETR